MIGARPDLDLASVYQFRAAATGSTPPHEGPMITGPSVELDNVHVNASLSVRDPTFLGTFDRTAQIRQIDVTINAHRGAEEQAVTPRSTPVALPVREQIAWARVALGTWADHAYRVVTDMSQFRARPIIFVVFIDQDGRPQLAPDDFQWIQASSGGRRAYADKLVPEDPGLLSYLQRNPDLIPAGLVPNPDAPSSPQVWAYQFIAQLARCIADYLGPMHRNSEFTLDELSLHGSEHVTIRYTWHLVEGDKAYGFDIDLARLRAQRETDFNDPRAHSAAAIIGQIPFEQPIFRSPPGADGVTWAQFGTPT